MSNLFSCKERLISSLASEPFNPFIVGFSGSVFHRLSRACTMISFTKKRTIIATVEVEPQNQDSFNLNDFLSLYVDKNPFAYLSSFVFGIIPLNAQAKQYLVSFKTGNDTVMQELLQRFQYSQNVETLSHRIVKISFSKPKPPPQTVTLLPVSHEITFDMLKNLMEGNRWGKMLNFAYGRHKLFPQFHNAYLHLHINNYSPNLVPDKITVNNSTVVVIKPGEGNVLRCNFVKTRAFTDILPAKKATFSTSQQTQPSHSILFCYR